MLLFTLKLFFNGRVSCNNIYLVSSNVFCHEISQSCTNKRLKYWSIQINIRFLVLFLPFISITCNIGISCYSTIMTVRIWSTNMSWWWWVSDTEEKIYGSWLGFNNCLLVKRIQIWNALTLFLLSLSSDVWVRIVDYCVTDLDRDSIT